MVYVTKTVTIPANSYVNVDVSSDVTGGSMFVTSAYLNTYQLPYSENGAVKTWVYTISGRTIRIQNNTGAWNNYTLYLTLAVLS